MSLYAFPGVADALFVQCPSVGRDTGCEYLITVTDHGTTIQRDSSQPPYDNGDESLIGIQNSSFRSIQSIKLVSATAIFSFDGDGICNNGNGPAPAGCQPPPGSSVVCNPSTVNTNHCSFAPPTGEPAGYTEPGATNFSAESSPPTTAPAPWPNGDFQNGYEGPGTWFSNVAANGASGVVNFSPPLASGKSTYFSVDEPNSAVAAVIDVPMVPTRTTTTLYGDSLKGSALIVPQGASVTDRAQITGRKASTAGGTVNYAFFRDKSCKVSAGPVSHVRVVHGAAGWSKPVKLAPGKYYARATYNGDTVNSPSVSRCGSSVVIVAKRFRSGLPSGRACVASHTLAFYLRGPKAPASKTAQVEVNGKLVGKVKLGKTPVLVVLKKLPPGRFHIEIIVAGKRGTMYEDSHAYHSCPRRKGH
jgi:hypothetical protein